MAKYMPDLRRRESLNIGVVLTSGGITVSKFQGQRPDGTIDGRSVRWAHSVNVYKSWVHYWKHLISSPKGPELEKLTRRSSGQNYIMEPCGDLLSGSVMDPYDMVEYLYSTLVEPEAPAPASLSVEQLSVSLFNNLGIGDRVRRRYSFAVSDETSSEDEISFDYRFDSDAVNLMQRVSLAFSDSRSWETLHAAAWILRKAARHGESFHGRQRLIALIKGREPDEVLEKQLRILGEHTDAVVDVTQQREAQIRLAEMLHVSPRVGT
ncbi:hypothetical protein ACSRUE_00790 [Sorangium sp. KYC3313]|uniref:hypothetical protein n=1 Tax=Sorangium sp. KYC3313 TaxID=3449740 RepID=UPI003F8CEA8E